MKTAPLTLYSIRFSSAYGWKAYTERTCADEIGANLWLDVFKSDEPSVHFLVSRKKPTAKQIADIVEAM